MTKGYLLNLRGNRLDKFLDNQEYFSEPVPKFEHSRGFPLVVFISTEDGCLNAIAYGKKGISAGTGLQRLNLSDIHELSRKIEIFEVLELVSPRVKRHIESVFESGGSFPPRTFVEIVDAIKRIEPHASSVIDRYSTAHKEALGRLTEKELGALNDQKEAVNTAMSLAGLDRKPLSEWSATNLNSNKSFIDGLPEVYMREDAMLINDLNIVPGFQEIKRNLSGVVSFEKGQTRLDVIMANRTKLEEQTGADLIYYNVRYNSFVLVQYKAMDEEEPKFRLPNKQLAEELKRMDDVLDKINPVPKPDHRDDYRLTNNPFFIKICKRTAFNPDDISLTPGMYFTREHFALIEKDIDIIGPKGGVQITFENMSRHINNTEFIGLVQSAWVGTVPPQSKLIEELIKEILKTGKSVIYAIESVVPVKYDEGDEPDY